MSVATEFPPDVYIPVPARPRVATVLPFRARPLEAAPGEASDDASGAVSLRGAAGQTARIYPVRPAAVRAPFVAPLRLTRRGYLAVGLLAAVLTSGLLWLAHASAPPARPAVDAGAAVVTVHDGDTLWSIATRIAPQRDPRTVVAALERINQLAGPVLQPGQVLRTR
jgi:Tfp pilus assembly protein FimV